MGYCLGLPCQRETNDHPTNVLLLNLVKNPLGVDTSSSSRFTEAMPSSKQSSTRLDADLPGTLSACSSFQHDEPAGPLIKLILPWDLAEASLCLGRIRHPVVPVHRTDTLWPLVPS